MNWFERYYISGAYFVSLTLVWFYALIPTHPIWNRLEGITAFGAFIALPVGYILAASTQYFYGKGKSGTYCTFGGLGTIFSNVLERICSQRTLLQSQDEFTIEAELSTPERLTGVTEEGDIKERQYKNIERLKWLSEIITKRFAVLAISGNFIIATPLAILLTSIICLIKFYPTPWAFSWIRMILSVIIIVVLVILHLNNRRLKKQIITIYTQMIENTPNLKKEVQNAAGKYGRSSGERQTE